MHLFRAVGLTKGDLIVGGRAECCLLNEIVDFILKCVIGCGGDIILGDTGGVGAGVGNDGSCGTAIVILKPCVPLGL